jgi:hypothetical protein
VSIFGHFPHLEKRGAEGAVRCGRLHHFVGQSDGLKPPIYASIRRIILGAGRLAVDASERISIR